MIFFDTENQPTREFVSEEEQLNNFMLMNFRELRVSQILYETQRAGTDMSLAEANTPAYLLQRGIVGETAEALEAALIKQQKTESNSFRNEAIDIIVFLASFYNHIYLHEAEIHERVQRLLPSFKPRPPFELLVSDIPNKAEELLSIIREFVPSEHEDLDAVSDVIHLERFRDNAVLLGLLIDALLVQVGMSQDELEERTGQTVMGNFAKYREKNFQGRTLAEGLAFSRKNHKKKKVIEAEIPVADFAQIATLAPIPMAVETVMATATA